MPLVQEVSPFTAPSYDVFSPARRQDPRGAVLGAPLDGGQSYTPWIGLSTVRELALAHKDRVGLVDEAVVAALSAELDRVLGELEDAQARVAELEANQERIAGLAKAGWKVQRVQGRPRESK